MNAIDIIRNIQELPNADYMTRRDIYAARVLISLANNAFKYGALTQKQKNFLSAIRDEHNLTKGQQNG